MTATYIITKNGCNELKPYAGPSCKASGVIPGRVYYDPSEASEDALKLTMVNRVGFVVHTLKNEIIYPFQTSENERKILADIHNQMWLEGLPSTFITNAISLAKTDQGINDLLNMWMQAANLQEKSEIVQDIEELISDWCSPSDNQTYKK
jgi:hypothetical protein